MLASTKEHHSRELAELTEQREALQDKLTQLQEKVDKPAMIKHTSPCNKSWRFVLMFVDFLQWRHLKSNPEGYRQGYIMGNAGDRKWKKKR